MILQPNVYSLDVLNSMNFQEHINSFFQLDIIVFEQIKDFIHFNLTDEQELLIDELILNWILLIM